MDTIEKGLQNIDQHRESAIKRHKELFAKAIYDAANISNNCCNNLDREFRKYFPEISNLNKETEIFNPSTVVEFVKKSVDNKTYDMNTKIIEGWDINEGLLPERKVMGNYYLDIGYKIDIGVYCKVHKVKVNKSMCGCCHQKNGPILEVIKNPSINFKCGHSKASYFKLGECGCIGATAFNNCIISDVSSPDIDRGNDKKIFQLEKTHTFEIDNYLNLYHKPSKLYLVFNKTAFPDIAFYFQKIIYDSKRLESLVVSNLLEQSYHKSLDKREDFLTNIKQIIPNDIKEKFNFFDKFRKFESFKSTRVVVNESEFNESEEQTLEKALQKRLNETILRAENAENIMNKLQCLFKNN